MSLVLGAAAAGVFGSAHCVGMCGPFATAGAGTRSEVAAWHAGRLATYATLGGLAGATGAAIPGPPWLASGLATALLLWFAARLAGWSPPSHWVPEGFVTLSQSLLARRGLASRVGFGMLTGLLPCGLVYAALGMPVAAADPALGALLMVVFGLGTVPALAVFTTALRGVGDGTPWVRRGVALGVLVAGLWSVHMRLPSASDDQPAAPACHDVADPG